MTQFGPGGPQNGAAPLFRVVAMQPTERLLDPRPEPDPGTGDVPVDGMTSVGGFPVVDEGYDPLEVQAFARVVAEQLAALSAENDELRRDAAHPRPVLVPDDDSLRRRLGPEAFELLEHIRASADEIVEQAEAQARRIVGAATRRADATRAEAQAAADRDRARARDEGRRLVADARADHRAMLAAFAAELAAADREQAAIVHRVAQLVGELDAAGAVARMVIERATPIITAH